MVEILRENQRILRRSIRDIERERVKLQNQEKTLKVDIRKMAQQGQMVMFKNYSPMFNCVYRRQLRLWLEILFEQGLILRNSIN